MFNRHLKPNYSIHFFLQELDKITEQQKDSFDAFNKVLAKEGGPMEETVDARIEEEPTGNLVLLIKVMCLTCVF